MSDGGELCRGPYVGKRYLGPKKKNVCARWSSRSDFARPSLALAQTKKKVCEKFHTVDGSAARVEHILSDMQIRLS